MSGWMSGWKRRKWSPGSGGEGSSRGEMASQELPARVRRFQRPEGEGSLSSPAPSPQKGSSSWGNRFLTWLGSRALVPEGTDLPLVAVVLALVLLGVTMVYSAGGVKAAMDYGDPLYLLKRQAVFAGLGLLAMLGMARIPYQVYKKWTYPALLLVALSLVAVLIPGVGTAMGGARRWIKLVGSFYIQPSEIAKLVLIVYLAYSLEKKQRFISTFSMGILPHLIVVGSILVLILAEPDFGTTATLGLILFAMMFVAGTRFIHLFGLGLVAAPVAFVVLMGEEYRRQRMLAFINPWGDPKDTGFQIIQSWLAFRGGGATGLGLGDGHQKLFFLPAAHTDFIFAVVAEELGLAGALGVILLFAAFVYRGIKAVEAAPDLFGRLLGLGITFMVGLQACINMCVVTGLLPTKGLTLPFVSYGGSSLIFGLAMVGVLLNITSQASSVRKREWPSSGPSRFFAPPPVEA